MSLSIPCTAYNSWYRVGAQVNCKGENRLGQNGQKWFLGRKRLTSVLILAFRCLRSNRMPGGGTNRLQEVYAAGENGGL